MSYSVNEKLLQNIDRLKKELYKVYDSGDWKKTVALSMRLDELLNRLNCVNSKSEPQN